MANPEDQPNRVPPSPPHQERRRLLTGILQAISLATGAAVAFVFRQNELVVPMRLAEPEKPQEVTPERREWATGELTENKIDAFMLAFIALDRKHIILIDQNGNPITGQPIPIPQEILAQENSPDFEQTFQAWLNRKRGELKEMYPTIHFHLGHNREEPTLLSVRTALSENVGADNLFDIVWENSQVRASPKNHVTRYQFAQRALAQSELPPSLAELFIGACAAESLFSEIGENEIGATGPWQIMPVEGRKYGLIGTKKITVTERIREKIFAMVGRGRKKKKVLRIRHRKQRRLLDQAFDDRNDFEKSTPAAAKILLDKYEELRRDKNITEVLAQYGVSEEDFLHLAAINAYQTGEGRVRNMTAWFVQNYPPERVKQILGEGPYGKDLYTLMASLYIQSGQDSLYGKQSRDYVIRAMAINELFHARLEGRKPEFYFDYAPPESGLEPEEVWASLWRDATQNGILSHGKTVGVGLLAGAVGVALDRRLEQDRPRRFNRREALAFGIGPLAAYIGRSVANVFHRKLEIRPGEVTAENIFAPFVLNEEKIRKKLLAMKPLNIIPQTSRERRRLRDSLGIGLEVARQNNLPEFSSDIIQPSGMIQLPGQVSRNYRLRGVGMLSDGKIENDDRYTFCYKHTQGVIEEIDRRLNEELRERGFSKNLHVRLIVKGLSRDKKFQKLLRGQNRYAARGDSPHMYGHTFDIHRAKYDVIDDEGYFTMVSTVATDPVNNQLNLATKINAILGRVLLAMKQEGKITVIHEGANPIYHISDLQPVRVTLE